MQTRNKQNNAIDMLSSQTNFRAPHQSAPMSVALPIVRSPTTVFNNG